MERTHAGADGAPPEGAKRTMAFNKSQYGDRIRQLRSRQALTQSQLARKLDVKKNTVANWEAGWSRPDINLLPRLCQALGVSLAAFFGQPSRGAELSQGEQQHIKSYRLLSKYNRAAVDTLTDALVEAQERAFRELGAQDFVRIRRFNLTASAGVGFNLNDEEHSEYVYVRAGRDACRADAIITVSGDSMQPTLSDGDDLLIEYASSLRAGEIGVFVSGGDGLVKEYQPDGLHSHNKAYPVLMFSPDDDVRVIGRVLGSVSAEKYATPAQARALDEMRGE